MSENELDDERGESYLEIQMDRSTIVVAALVLLALLAGAFLLGSWLGSRSRDGEIAGASAPGDAPADEAPLEHDGESVAAEDGFGGKPVSAKGAPAVRGVPAPAPAGSMTAAPPPGPSGLLLAEEDVGAPVRATAAKAAPAKPSAAKATAAKPTAAKPTAAKATAAKPTAAKATATAATAAAGGAGWIIQVAAVKEQREADQLAARLRKKGYPVRVVAESGLVKVQVGPFDSKPEAQAAEQRLKREEKVGTWLKRG